LAALISFSLGLDLQKSLDEERLGHTLTVFPVIHRAVGDANPLSELLLSEAKALAKRLDEGWYVDVVHGGRHGSLHSARCHQRNSLRRGGRRHLASGGRHAQWRWEQLGRGTLVQLFFNVSTIPGNTFSADRPITYPPRPISTMSQSFRTSASPWAGANPSYRDPIETTNTRIVAVALKRDSRSSAHIAGSWISVDAQPCLPSPSIRCTSGRRQPDLRTPHQRSRPR